MKASPLFGLACTLLLTTAASAQYQVQTQEDTRTQPAYPTSSAQPSPYSFRTQPLGYDPFQFNWFTGRFEYVPIPYDQQAGSPYQFNCYSGRWNYNPAAGASSASPGGQASAGQAPPPNVPMPSPPAAVVRQPDDSGLWSRPTTRPASVEAKVVEFKGKVVGLRAVNLMGDSRPHILLRLRADNNTTATVDVGDRLDLAEQTLLSKSDEQVSARGPTGRHRRHASHLRGQSHDGQPRDLHRP